MSTICERVQAVILSRLQGILTASGYASNMGQQVDRERMEMDESETFPRLNLQFVSKTPQGGSVDFGSMRNQFLVTWRVEIWRKSSSPEMLALIGDVERAVLVADSFGGVSDGSGKLAALGYGGTEQIAPPQDGQGVGGVAVTFTAKVIETWGSPSSNT